MANRKKRTVVTREDLYKLLYDSPVEVGHWLGLDKLGELHNQWLKNFLFRKDDQTLLAHRGSYKTTVGSLFLALHTIIKPSETVLYIRKTDTDVKEVVRQVEKILQSGAIRQMVKVLYGVDFVLTKCTDNEINTNLNTSVKGTSQLLALGVGSSITGKHFDIIYTDDIVNLTDRVSRAEREHTKLFYMELQNVLNRGGRIINTGTPWHKEDAIAELMPNVETYDCYSTNLMSQEEIQEKRGQMTPSLFAANYELRHIASDDALFPSEPKFTKSSELIYQGFAHVDAAYGGEDYTAFTGLKKTSDGYVGYGKIWHKHVDDCLVEIENLLELYELGPLYCEKNGDKGYLAKELTRRGIPTKTYSEKMNKYTKIATYLRRDWGKVQWIDDTDPDYLAQIQGYTEFAEHDDAPDSAASLIRAMEKKTTLNTDLKGGL